MAKRMLPSHDPAAFYDNWQTALAHITRQIAAYRDPLTPPQVVELTTLWTQYHALRACGGQIKDNELTIMTRLGLETQALVFADMRGQHSQRFAGRIAIYHAKSGDAAAHLDALITLADQHPEAQSHKELALILIAAGRFELANSMIRLLPEASAQTMRLRLVEACLIIGDQVSALSYAYSGLPDPHASSADVATFAHTLYVQRTMLIAEAYLKNGDEPRAIQMLNHSVQRLRFIYASFRKEIHDVWYLDRKTWYTPMLETIHRGAVLSARLGRWDEAVQFLHDFPLSILLSRQPLIAQLWTDVVAALPDAATLRHLYERLPDNLNHGQFQLLIARRAAELGERTIFREIVTLHSDIGYYRRDTRNMLHTIGTQALVMEWIRDHAVSDNNFEMLGRIMINEGRGLEALDTAEKDHPYTLLNLITCYLDHLRASGQADLALTYLEERWLRPVPAYISPERWSNELGAITASFFRRIGLDEAAGFRERLRQMLPRLFAVHGAYIDRAPLAESAALLGDYGLAYDLIQALKPGEAQANALIRLAQTCLKQPTPDTQAWARRCLLDAHAALNNLTFDDPPVRAYVREVLEDARRNQLHPGLPLAQLNVYVEQHKVKRLVPSVFDHIAAYWQKRAAQTYLETWLIALARTQEVFEQVQPGLTAEVLASAWRVMASFAAQWRMADIE